MSWPPSPSLHLGPPGRPTPLPRRAGTATVRYVFRLIWPQAVIDCGVEALGCRVSLWQGELRHVVHVPWALVEVDHGLVLARAVYRAGLPRSVQCAKMGLSLSL